MFMTTRSSRRQLSNSPGLVSSRLQLGFVPHFVRRLYRILATHSLHYALPQLWFGRGTCTPGGTSLILGEPLPALLRMNHSMIPTTVLSSLPVIGGESSPWIEGGLCRRPTGWINRCYQAGTPSSPQIGMLVTSGSA